MSAANLSFTLIFVHVTGPGKGSTESALLGPSSTKESRVSASSLNNDTERETEVWQQIEEQRSEIEKLEEELNKAIVY